MPNLARLVAAILIAGAVIGLAEPATQTAFGAGRLAVHITQDGGIGWD
jgi:hypothetical protein